MRIIVLVKPSTDNSSSRVKTSDLNAFALPSLFSAVAD
jgi:hypothetical protein